MLAVFYLDAVEVVDHQFLLVEVVLFLSLLLALALRQVLIALHVLSVALAALVLRVSLARRSLMRPASLDFLVRQHVLQFVEVLVLRVRGFPR